MGAEEQQFIPNSAQIGRLLRPASIAIIGATDSEGKTGAMITNNLLNGGFAGRVVCVNPHREQVFGAPCYPTLADAPDGHVDCAIVVVPAPVVADVIRASVSQCANFVVIAAGFGESGEEGRTREAELMALAQEHKLAILGPNCLGFITPGLKANASFAPHVLVPGNVALLSQSGALAVALLDRAAQTQQGFSFVVSLGNKMQIDEALLMEFLAQDDATQVIALYIESVADGARFIAAARNLATTKPIVVLRGGTTASGQRASMSHTGALMQEGAVFDAVCEKYGIVQTQTLTQFVDVIAFARRYGLRTPLPLAVVTNAGGLGVLATDAAERAGVPLERIASTTQVELAAQLPPAAATTNPIDVLGDADVSRYDHVFDVLARDTQMRTALTILTPQAQTPVMAVARTLAQRCARDDALAHIATFVGGARTDDAARFLMRSGVPTVRTPEDAMAACSALHRAHTRRYDARAHVDQSRQARAAHIFARAREEGRGALYYSEVAQLCEAYNIPLVRAWRMDYDSPSSVTFPCVVKVDAPSVLHKTDRGGVIVGVKDGTALNEAIETLQKRFAGERIIVQPMVAGGTEILIGAQRDATFGPTLLIGYGGIYAEEIAMTHVLVPPFDAQQARERLVRSRLGFLFRETRGQAPHDAAQVAHIAAALGQMMLENAWINTVDINPLFLYNDGKSATVVDMKIVIS